MPRTISGKPMATRTRLPNKRRILVVTARAQHHLCLSGGCATVTLRAGTVASGPLQWFRPTSALQYDVPGLPSAAKQKSLFGCGDFATPRLGCLDWCSAFSCSIFSIPASCMVLQKVQQNAATSRASKQTNFQARPSAGAC